MTANAKRLGLDVHALARRALGAEVDARARLSVDALEVLQSVLAEALRDRRDEFAARGYDSRVLSVAELRLAIRPGLSLVLQDATRRTQGGTVMAIHVLGAIARSWCKVWPFCLPE